MSEKDERLWGMLCHLVALSGFLVPFGNLIGPIIIWTIKKDQSAFVDDQGKESTNFQILVTIAAVVSAALTPVCIGFVLLPIVVIAQIIFVIMASLQANGGQRYRYPLNIRFIK